LTYAEGRSLILPFTETEVKNAVWDCDSFKSPSPDGVNLGFIKDFWEDIEGDIMRFISKFHRNGKLSRGINSTSIALIPKVDSPQKLNDFRPIKLVGCLYKILSKVLANRLRLIIGRVVSDTQTSFVKDRQILDGILIANEVVDEADTLLIGEKSWANVRALRAVLTLFADMSGLKVNFSKSLLVGINIGDFWLVEAASLLNCKVGKISFLYLGLSIGGDPRKLAFWEPVINTIKTRLAGWQSRFLSYGGRLILLKSVLTSLPVYALSFFKAPSGIISLIESIFNKKF